MGRGRIQGAAPQRRWYRLRRAALSYHRLRGDPGAAQVWEDLAELSETLIPHASGVLIRPAVTGIDVGGHYGPQVSEFVKGARLRLCPASRACP